MYRLRAWIFGSAPIECGNTLAKEALMKYECGTTRSIVICVAFTTDLDFVWIVVDTNATVATMAIDINICVSMQHI